jgi:hypothetical protein
MEIINALITAGDVLMIEYCALSQGKKADYLQPCYFVRVCGFVYLENRFIALQLALSTNLFEYDIQNQEGKSISTHVRETDQAPCLKIGVYGSTKIVGLKFIIGK